MKQFLLLIVLFLSLSACGSLPPTSDEQLKDQVIKTESAFAKTMADRDVKAFASYISNEAIFFSDDNALRGRAAILSAWTPFFKGSAAPFSWSPHHVEVLESGRLALSSGPVLNAKGDVVATFNSIWRREDSGEWRIVFDKGCDVCVRCADKAN